MPAAPSATQVCYDCQDSVRRIIRRTPTIHIVTSGITPCACIPGTFGGSSGSYKITWNFSLNDSFDLPVHYTGFSAASVAGIVKPAGLTTQFFENSDCSGTTIGTPVTWDVYIDLAGYGDNKWNLSRAGFCIAAAG